MPKLNPLPKLKSKAALGSWLDNTLAQALANKPLLATAMQQQIQMWRDEHDKLPDTKVDLPAVIDANDNVAFKARREANAKAHDDYLGKVQEMIQQGTQYGKGVEKKLQHNRALVEQDVRDWDANEQRYQREFDAYDEKNKAHHQDYEAAIATLRQGLEQLRLTYNRSYFLHEDMTDETREIFLTGVAEAQLFVPTRHSWKANVSSGTYMYDFAVQKFQLHIHSATYNGKIVSVRVKLYGEQDGKGAHYKTMSEAIAESFRKQYPPLNSSNWTQIN